jgi:hypothetical protein
MKSVPNLISYLHEFFQNFSQSLAICFELFSFGVIFNSEITDERAPPVRRRAPRRHRGLKPLSGQRAARPDSSPRLRHRHPDSALALAARPTASPRSSRPRRCPVRSRPSLSERHDRHCPAASAVASTTTVSVARALLSPFFIRGASSSPSPPSSPSQDHRRPP